jgi:hypothetical protein
MGCFSSTTRTKSTVYLSFFLSWTIVRGLPPMGTILMCENKRFNPTKAIYTLITTQNIKVGHSILYFSSTTQTESTECASFCSSWTMVRSLQPLGTILMCENKRFYPTKTIYTLITPQNIKVGHSILYFSWTTKAKYTVYISFCFSWTMVRSLRPLETILMCENKRFHPTKAIYTLKTT